MKVERQTGGRTNTKTLSPPLFGMCPDKIKNNDNCPRNPDGQLGAQLPSKTEGHS